MSIATVVTGGFGNGTFSTTIGLVTTMGYGVGAAVTPTPEPAVVASNGGGGGYYGGRARPRAVSGGGRRREETISAIAAEMRALYIEATAPDSELPGDYADAIADVVSPYAPPSAPDLPASGEIDWQALADAGRETVKEATRVLALARARVAARQAQQNQAVLLAKRNDEAAALLLLAW